MATRSADADIRNIPFVARRANQRMRVVVDGHQTRDRLIELPIPDHAIKFLCDELDAGEREGVMRTRDRYEGPEMEIRWYVD